MAEGQDECRMAFEKWWNPQKLPEQAPDRLIRLYAEKAWQAAWDDSRNSVIIENDRVCIGGRWFLPTDAARDPRAECGLVKALQRIVDFCDDPDGSEKPESLAMGMARLLPEARDTLAKHQATSRHDDGWGAEAERLAANGYTVNVAATPDGCCASVVGHSRPIEIYRCQNAPSVKAAFESCREQMALAVKAAAEPV